MGPPTHWHILIIDDNPDDRAEFRRMLIAGSGRTCRFTEAELGATGLQMVLDNQAQSLAGTGPLFDCVLLDFHLPDIDGVQWLNAVCGASGMPPCPVVVMTGWDGVDGSEGPNVLRAGAQDYIGKCWTTAPSLCRAIENSIDRFKLLQSRDQVFHALAHAEERYRTLFNSIDEGFCVIEMIYDEHENPIDWRFLEVNSAFERQNGLSDATGKRMRELAPDIEPVWFNIYGEVARTGESKRFQNEAKASGERWFDLYAFRIAERGNYKVAVLFKDITEHRKAQEASQNVSQYARSLIEASLDPLVTISADGKITDVNAATEEVTGSNRDNLIGSDFADYFTDSQKAREGYQHVFLKGSVTDYPLAIRHVSGKITDVVYNASVYRDTQGNVLGVFAAARDITDRKKAEELTQAASQYARSLLEASLDPLVTISAEGKITDVNIATEQVTGVSREILIGSDFADYFTDSQKAREGYQQVFLKGSVTDYPLAIRHVSGKITDVVYNASVYRDTKGNVLGVFAAARDITESKHLGQALQKRNIDLEKATSVAEEASLAKSHFLSSMSHELRTPLNAILGFAQLIESNVSPPTPSQKRSLDQILSAGWYLLELVNEILDLAQIESGKAVMMREAVPLEHIMSECQELVEPLARKRGIEISFPRMERPHWVDADLTRTRQVLINLLHNAIKYNKPGGMVSMACTLVPPNSVRISVRDTGPGLSPEQLGQLFQPFNRLGRESGAEQGTGIGLVVVKQLVELMGGVIHVESQVGVGSVFSIELNLTTAPLLTTSETEQTARHSPKPTDGTIRRTVLYVEDNPANLALVEELLTRRPDLRLISAADGNLGVEYARTYLPEVILMDLHLPSISGTEAMKALRADPTTAHIPVIALSAQALPADITKAMEAGFFNYITKPIKLNEFMAALDAALKFFNTKSSDAAVKAPTKG